MITIPSDQILQLTKHRPFPLSDTKWLLYQQWKDVLFLHSPVEPKLLNPLLPGSLKLDLISGYAWLSVVIFRVENSRTRLMPFIPVLPSFTELNLRTYVRFNDIPGIHFLQIEANSKQAVFMNRILTKLPYRYADIRNLPPYHYFASTEQGTNILDIDFHPGSFFSEVPGLDRWLTERYCAYQHNGRKLYRYDIHHAVWPLYNVQTNYHMLRYNFPDLNLTDQSVHLLHYSPLQSALIWPGKRIA